MHHTQFLQGVNQDDVEQQQECNPSVRVLIVEKCKLLRSAMYKLVIDMPCVGAISEVDSLSKIPQILDVISPTVLFIHLNASISLKEFLKLMHLVKAQYPHTGMIALMERVVPEVVCLLTKAGINGLLDDGATQQDLASAIQAGALGNIFHSRRIYEQILLPDKISQLTTSEMHTLALVMKGDTNYLIAQKMHITTKTVEAHLTRIYKKLDVTSRVQAIIRAQELHLSFETTLLI